MPTTAMPAWPAGSTEAARVACVTEAARPLIAAVQRALGVSLLGVDVIVETPHHHHHHSEQQQSSHAHSHTHSEHEQQHHHHIDGGGRLLLLDVNYFPSFRGFPRLAQAFDALVQQRAEQRAQQRAEQR